MECFRVLNSHRTFRRTLSNLPIPGRRVSVQTVDVGAVCSSNRQGLKVSVDFAVNGIPSEASTELVQSDERCQERSPLFVPDVVASPAHFGHSIS